jgi:hypothetical protein
MRLLQLSLVACASGFTPQMQLPAAHPATRSTTPLCSLSDRESTSRRAVLSGMLGVALGVGSRPAWAGYVTSLGIETTSPKDAEKDGDLLSSKEVQQTLTNLNTYKTAAAGLKAKFAADTNMVLIPAIRNEFDFSKVRDDLNVASTVFDDQTQLTTDRVARSILYDLTELENAARLKKGDPERTPKKIANVDKWFVKLDTDLNQFLAYFS